MTTLDSRTNLRPNVGLSLPQFGQFPTAETRTGLESLTAVVRTAVRGVDESTLRPVARRDSGPAYQPRLLLALLTCCYARDIFSSAEIERLMQRDAGFRCLCGSQYPNAKTLRNFRRLNRAAVQECLETALQFLSHTHEHSGAWRADATVAAEALRRLDMAACMDTLEFDS